MRENGDKSDKREKKCSHETYPNTSIDTYKFR